MKVLKYLFLLLLLVIVGGSLYIMISNKNFTVNQKIKIKAPRELVFDQIKDLKNWEKWISIDKESLNLSFSEKKDAEHSYLTWNDKKESEEGRLEHRVITHYSSIEQTAKSKSSLAEATYKINWNLAKKSDSTEIQLKMDVKPNFFTKVKMALDKDSTQEFLDVEAKNSLQNLEALVLKKMAAYQVTIEGLRKSPTKHYIYITEASVNKPDLIEEKREQTVNTIKKQLDSLHIKYNQEVLMVYNSVDKEHHSVIFSSGVSVSASTNFEQLGKNLLVGTLPEHNYLKGILQGNYINIPKLWEKARVYMIQNHLTQDTHAQPYEVYKISAKNSSNPADWVTELYIPVKPDEDSSRD